MLPLFCSAEIAARSKLLSVESAGWPPHLANAGSQTVVRRGGLGRSPPGKAAAGRGRDVPSPPPTGLRGCAAVFPRLPLLRSRAKLLAQVPHASHQPKPSHETNALYIVRLPAAGSARCRPGPNAAAPVGAAHQLLRPRSGQHVLDRGRVPLPSARPPNAGRRAFPPAANQHAARGVQQPRPPPHTAKLANSAVMINRISANEHTTMNTSTLKPTLFAIVLFSLPAAAVFEAHAGDPPSKPGISIFTQTQAPPSGPIQLTPPAIAEEGFTARLSASVQGSAPLTFQWSLNGAAIDGATNAVYMVQTLERADEGTYSVLVTNSFGQATSDPARLLVSNVKPASYVALLVNSPTNGVLQIQRGDSLSPTAPWQLLAGVTSSASPLVIVDPDAPNLSQRFYKTPRAQGLTARLINIFSCFLCFYLIAHSFPLIVS